MENRLSNIEGYFKYPNELNFEMGMEEVVQMDVVYIL